MRFKRTNWSFVRLTDIGFYKCPEHICRSLFFALVWEREDNERRSRSQSELERDEQELAELEILFAAVRLQRPSKSAQENVADTYGWETVRRKIFRCEGGSNKSTMAGYVNYGDDKTIFLGDSSLQPADMCWPSGVLRVITSNLRQMLRASGKELPRHGCMSSRKESVGHRLSVQHVTFNIAHTGVHAFAARRGFPSIVQAVDGTHVPFNPISCPNKYLYKNYRRWFS